METTDIEPGLIKQYIQELITSRHQKLSFLAPWPAGPVFFREELLASDFLAWVRETFPGSLLSSLQPQQISAAAISRRLKRRLAGKVRVIYRCATLEQAWGYTTTQIRVVKLAPLDELGR